MPCGPSASPGCCLLLPSHSAPGTTSSAARQKPEVSQDPPSTNLGTQAELWVLAGAPTTLQVSHVETAFPEEQGQGNVYTEPILFPPKPSQSCQGCNSGTAKSGSHEP